MEECKSVSSFCMLKTLTIDNWCAHDPKPGLGNSFTRKHADGIQGAGNIDTMPLTMICTPCNNEQYRQKSNIFTQIREETIYFCSNKKALLTQLL